MQFLETVYRIMNLYNQKTRVPKHYGTEDLLYPAEVHLLELIGSGDGITTTQLAERLAITKGAVSQTTARLLDKQLVLKTPAPGQRREQLFTLSEKGNIVYRHHRQLHQSMLERVEAVWRLLPQESRTVLEQLVAVLEDSLNEMEEMKE